MSTHGFIVTHYMTFFSPIYLFNDKWNVPSSNITLCYRKLLICRLFVSMLPFGLLSNTNTLCHHCDI